MKNFFFAVIIITTFFIPCFSQVRQRIKKNEPPPDQQVIQMPQEPVKQTVAQAFSKIDLLANPTQFLVLGKQRFAEAVQPFINHKNNKGISAAFVDIESLTGYRGVDEPEKIKMAIADAYTRKGVRYVMLAGDASVFPVRHWYVSNGFELGRTADPIKDNAWWWFEGGYNPTDFYYANLFHHNPDGSPSGFSSWDDNGNKKYNEQVWQFQGNGDNQAMNTVTFNPDNVDGYADIALARVPVHDENDLSIFVNKLIRYETGLVPPKKGIAFLAAASYPGSAILGDQVFYYNNYALQKHVGDANAQHYIFNMKNFDYEHSFFYPNWDNGNFASISTAMTKSWALVYIGHGYNLGWELKNNDTCWFDDQGGTHWINNEKQNFDYTNAASMWMGGALPVIFSLGCETGQFKPNVPTHEYIDIYNQHKWYWAEKGKVWDRLTNVYYNISSPIALSPPSPYDLNDKLNRTFAYSWLMNKNGAGGIAFFGETVVCENYHAKDLIERVLYESTQNKNRLGDIWLSGQRQYWNDFRSNTNVFHNPRIYLSIMTFFGDPTLEIQR